MAANHPAKKMKIEEISDDKTIKDPFVRVHEHVREVMLQHFTGKEVLSVMEVSNDWNEIIAGSRKCMSKVKLNIKEKSPTDPNLRDVKELLQSDRSYQNMKLFVRNLTNSDRKFLLLQRFSQSLVEIELTTYNYERGELPENMTFPKLESLKLFILANANQDIMKCFANVSSLKKFETYGSDLIESSAVEWLKKQSQLKELTLRYVGSFKLVVLLDASFKLESLTLKSCTEQHADLNMFLLSQADSLVHLKVYALLHSQNVKIIFNHLPKLKTFSCSNVYEGVFNVNDLNPNQSLVEFNSGFFHPPQSILKSLVNLEILTCTFNRDDEVVWAFKNLKKLKNCFVNCPVYRLPFSAISTAYRTLKESGALGDREIEIHQITV
jgi:hypothetical protein